MPSIGQLAFCYIFIGVLCATYALSTAGDGDLRIKLKTSFEEMKLDRAHRQMLYMLIFSLAAVFFAGLVVTWPIFTVYRVASWFLHRDTPEAS